MSRYKPAFQDTGSTKKWEVHPVWRGIGCVFMLLIPIMSYALSIIFVTQNLQQGWIPLPREVLVTVNLPLLGAVRYLYANLIFAAAFSVLMFAGLTVIYSFVSSIAGPSRYGPYDVPPPKRRGRLKKSR